MKQKMQLFGKTLIFPISLLSFFAVFMGLAAALQNEDIIALLPFLSGDLVQNFLGFVRKLAGLPFAQLPLLFAMAIPLGMVKRDKDVAVYSSVAGYIALLLGMNYYMGILGITADTTSVDYLVSQGMDPAIAAMENSAYTNVLGYYVYNMNIIAGIIAGLVTVVLHNRFRSTELPEFLSFYSGRRFVPIISVLVLSLVGMALVYIWPLINSVIFSIGTFISGLGAFGVFLYGFLEKLINPTGLHHILNQTFRFTALGGTEVVNGEVQVGALNIYLAQFDSGAEFTKQATAYLAQGKILHMVFGMPAAVFAMYKVALPEKRKKLLKFFIPGLVAVILTGITEPIEFTFIFISPILYVVNAIFAGLAFLVPALLGVAIGNIQGGVIDWLVFGVLQGGETKWYVYLWWGPAFFAMYYFSYAFIIRKFNVMTLGRNQDDFEEAESGAINVDLDNDDEALATIVIDGLGGLDNILDVDNCISRLRVEVKDGSKIDEKLIKLSKPNGIIRPSEVNIQIVYGGRVTKVRNVVDDYILKYGNGEINA